MKLDEIKNACDRVELFPDGQRIPASGITLSGDAIRALIECAEAAAEVMRLDFSADASCDCMRCVAWRALDAALEGLQ